MRWVLTTGSIFLGFALSILGINIIEFDPTRINYINLLIVTAVAGIWILIYSFFLEARLKKWDEKRKKNKMLRLDKNSPFEKVDIK